MAKSAQLARLTKRFQAIPVAVRKAVEPSLDKSADELVAMQQHLAPVGEGELRESIEKRPGDHELSRKVATDDYKARWLEHGTVKMAAQPFFWPAYRLLKKRIANRVKRSVSKAVKEGWNK